MKILAAGAAMIFFAAGALAETTNDWSDAEIQGRNLAGQLLEQTPATNFSQNGVFNIRDGKGNRSEISLRFSAIASGKLSTDSVGKACGVSKLFSKPIKYFYN